VLFIYRSLLLVQFFPQLHGALESDHFPWSQHQVLSCRRIPTASFLFHTEFTEAGNQYIIARRQGLFDEFQQYYDGINRPFAGESVSFCYCVDDVGFGEGVG
jgi:hypothetical protein